MTDLETVRGRHNANAILEGKTWRQADREFNEMIRKVQADAIRNAAIKAQEAYVAEQGGVGYARVRTDWLHEEANRIERGSDD